MIVDKILNNCNELPTKVAISYQGRDVSYGELKTEILQRQNELCEGVYSLIINSDPILSLIHFLAASLKKQKVLVVPKDWKADRYVGFEEIEKCVFEIGILSSGSSGEPKVIWKTNDNWEAAFHHQSDLFGIGKSDNVFVLEALSYSANLNSAIHALWCGATLVLDSLKNANTWPDLIKTKEISSIFLVPSHWNLLLEKAHIFSNVRSCLSAGEKLNGKQAREILKLFPKSRLTEYYGAAELGHISYQQNEEIVNSPQSVGKAFPGVEVKIVEQQIHVNSPYISPKFKEKGTVGDLGYLDNERLVLLGRSGRMFNKRGINVFAQEIEQVILLHPSVNSAHLRSVNVLSVPKLELIYDVKLSIETFNESELWKLLNLKLEKAKHPHFLKKVEKIPTNSYGKIAIGQLSKKLDEEAVVYMQP